MKYKTKISITCSYQWVKASVNYNVYEDTLFSHLAESWPVNIRDTRQWAQGFALWQWHLSDGLLHILLILLLLLTWISLILCWLIQFHIHINDTEYWFSSNTFYLDTFEWKKNIAAYIAPLFRHTYLWPDEKKVCLHKHYNSLKPLLTDRNK